MLRLLRLPLLRKSVLSVSASVRALRLSVRDVRGTAAEPTGAICITSRTVGTGAVFATTVNDTVATPDVLTPSLHRYVKLSAPI